MERFNALGRGMQLMLVGSVLLFIDLFLPWQKYTGPGADLIQSVGGDTSRSAFHGFGGWLLGLLTLILIAWIVARLAAVEIPIPVSAAMTAAVIAFLILAFAVIKALVDDYSGWAAWVGIALAIVIAVGAWLQIQESGGVENLRTEASSLAGSRAGAGAAGTAAGGAAVAEPPAPEPMGGTPPAEPASPAPPPPMESAPAVEHEPPAMTSEAAQEAAEPVSDAGDAAGDEPHPA